MQRRELITPGAVIAPVGHAGRQRRQWPQPRREGGVGGSGSESSTSARRTYDPASRVSRQAFLPAKPMPGALGDGAVDRPAVVDEAVGAEVGGALAEPGDEPVAGGGEVVVVVDRGAVRGGEAGVRGEPAAGPSGGGAARGAAASPAGRARRGRGASAPRGGAG